VPCLKVGSVTLTESMAIAEYLEERQPAPPLLPADPLQRAEVRELCEAVNTFVHPMQRTRVVKFFVPGADKAAATALRVRWLGESLAAVERMPRSAEGFAVGGVFSLADVFIVPVLVKFVGMGGGLGRLPRLASLLSACLKDPAALAAAPKDLELGKLKPGVA
jgi:glutathione S-transferase